MAEAFSTSEEDASSKVASEFSITDCAICLERLRKPKSLPCLHTFCEDCLSTFIKSNNTPEATPVFFNCPVCRRRTLPVEPSSTPDIWASQFRTNNFVVEMMKKLNSDDTNKHLCHLCLKRDRKETPPTCWCQDCRYFLCENCNKGHQLVLFDHKTISIEELSQHSTVLLPIESNCDKHGKNIELICLDHMLLCCHTCIAIEHRKCDNVSTVIEYAENLYSKGKFQELSEDVDKNVSSIDSVISEYRGKLDPVTKDKDAAMQRLSDVREWFDSQMSRMSNEVMKVYKVETEKIHRALEHMETVRSSLLQTKTLSKLPLQTVNEHQLVSIILRGKSEIERCEQIIQSKQNENSIIILKFMDDFEKLTKEKQDIGTVEVNKQKTNPLFGRAAKQKRTVTVPGSGQYIKGMFVLPTGHIVLSDYSHQQLLYVTESGVVLSTLKLGGQPWDICQMPDGNIAVSLRSSRTIAIISLFWSRLSSVKVIKLTEYPCGITFYDGALHITTEFNGLYRVSDRGQLIHLHQFDANSSFLITMKSDFQIIGNLRELNEANSAVFRVSRDNTFTEVIKADIVKDAGGIDVDDEDNIYVCGFGSNNVMQISADGSRKKELLTSQDVSAPFLLNVRGTELYICEDGSRIIKIYQLE